MQVMKQEALLLEQVTLAEEILEYGPGEGRGIRLAALVLRLNEYMQDGKLPLSWSQPPPPSVHRNGKPSPLVREALDRALKDIDTAWEDDDVLWLKDGEAELLDDDG